MAEQDMRHIAAIWSSPALCRDGYFRDCARHVHVHELLDERLLFGEPRSDPWSFNVAQLFEFLWRLLSYETYLLLLIFVPLTRQRIWKPTVRGEIHRSFPKATSANLDSLQSESCFLSCSSSRSSVNNDSARA